MAAPAVDAVGFVPTVGQSAASSKLDICRAILDLHTFHAHRKHFRSSGWQKLYRCIVQFSVDREYGSGQLATAYLHYRLRTLYRLCGEGAPHADEKPDRSREKKRIATTRRRQLLRQSNSHAANHDSVASSWSVTESPVVPQPPRQQPQPTPSITSAALSRFHDAHPDTQCLTSLFRLYTQRCSPLHGADVDMGNLPEKRHRTPPSDRALQPDRSIPDAVSPGYAECTRKAFDKVCEWLCESAPPDLRMNADSVFLDVGCGYGKCVIQARLRANVRKSIGIEYVAVRYLMGYKMLAECVPAQFESVHARLDGCVELLQGDATDEQFVEEYKMATHIFAFDWVFNDVGKQGVLRCVEQSSSMRVFITCQRLDHLPGFRKLHQMKLSTGVQHPTVYFYAGQRGAPAAIDGTAR